MLGMYLKIHVITENKLTREYIAMPDIIKLLIHNITRKENYKISVDNH